MAYSSLFPEIISYRSLPFTRQWASWGQEPHYFCSSQHPKDLQWPAERRITVHFGGRERWITKQFLTIWAKNHIARCHLLPSHLAPLGACVLPHGVTCSSLGHSVPLLPSHEPYGFLFCLPGLSNMGSSHEPELTAALTPPGSLLPELVLPILFRASFHLPYPIPASIFCLPISQIP